MENAIEIRELSKSFHNVLTREDVLAVDHLNLDIKRGEIFGFLGPNGAGKTTTIKMLLGLIFPTGGDASILGEPPGDIDIKRKISYLPESPVLLRSSQWIRGAGLLWNALPHARRGPAQER